MDDHFHFEARYGSWAALKRDMEQQLSMGGLLLRTGSEEEAERGALVKLRLVAPDDRYVDVQARVLQIIPGQGLALQFEDAGGAMQQELSAWWAQAVDDDLRADDPQVSRFGAEEEDAGPDKPAYQKIEEMSVPEKRRAALRGKKDMRLLLIRDRNKTIHSFVLKNPAITLDEIEQIAKMPGVNPDALRMIARNKDWTRSVTVVRNLVRNPKTPMPEALRLMDKLPKNEIRAMAKSSNVRTALQQKARKIVNG